VTEPSRIFSAIQPSGALTLGNYLGAIRGWVELQRSAPDDERLFCVADYHAITVRPEPRELRARTQELVLDLLAVPVGEDQLQPLELARQIARRFNQRFGRTFPEPAPILNRTARILSLADPAQKMSKSLGAKRYLGLFEDDSSIRAKIQAAVTDSGGPDAGPSSGVENLFRILAATAPSSEYERFERARTGGLLRYAELKGVVAEHLVSLLPVSRIHIMST
jgi:tryptophanyl-tRNA synthetase